MSSKCQQARNRRTILPGQVRRRDTRYGCMLCPEFSVDRLKDTDAMILKGQITLQKHVREKHPEMVNWVSAKTEAPHKEFYGPSVQQRTKKGGAAGQATSVLALAEREQQAGNAEAMEAQEDTVEEMDAADKYAVLARYFSGVY